jgi:hypothetical protein
MTKEEVKDLLDAATVDTDDDSIGCSFNDFGYHLLPTLFEFIGLKSDFV